jgi:hypothetical protein
MTRSENGVEADVENRKIRDAPILQSFLKNDVVEGRVTHTIRLANGDVDGGIRHWRETTLRDHHVTLIAFKTSAACSG